MAKELMEVPKIDVKFLALIKELMNEHSLTEQEVLYLLAKECNLVWSITGDSVLKLFRKNLLNKDEVKHNVLFRRYKAEQVEIDFAFESSEKTSDKTQILFTNLWNTFIDEKEFNSSKIESIASLYFTGDKTIAKYFILFISLFPQRSLSKNSRWNKAFGIVFEGTTRQTWSLKVAKSYLKLYKKSDIDPAILASAVYFFIKDSIDTTGDNFISKPQVFLDNYSYWYSYAKTEFDKQTAKPDIDAVNLINV